MDERDVVWPTDEEEAAINRGIAQDPENPEWTAADGAAAFRVGDPAMPPDLAESIRRVRGAQKTPTKEMISLRLDRDVLNGWRSTGAGWQGRMNEALRKALQDAAA